MLIRGSAERQEMPAAVHAVWSSGVVQIFSLVV
jgi:hypothetical protein